MTAQVCPHCNEKNNPQFAECWKCHYSFREGRVNERAAEERPKPFLRIFLPAAVLGFLTVTAIQTTEWVARNGFSFSGKGVNHFGEPYQSDVLEWIVRPYQSVFAWPALVIIFILYLIVISVITERIEKRRKREGVPAVKDADKS